MTAKGYIIVANSKNAGYLLTANLLYMGKKKDGFTAESMRLAVLGCGSV